MITYFICMANQPLYLGSLISASSFAGAIFEYCKFFGFSKVPPCTVFDPGDIRRLASRDQMIAQLTFVCHCSKNKIKSIIKKYLIANEGCP